MNTINNHINKRLYKIFLITLKYIPIFLACIHTVNIYMQYVGMELVIFPLISGTSFPFLLLLFIMSYVFQFCYLYRIPLWYLTLNWLMIILDALIGIPISTLNIFRIYAIMFGIFIIIFIIYMYKNRNKPKIDHFKQMCENYTRCCS